jgi:hypothetical protein
MIRPPPSVQRDWIVNTEEGQLFAVSAVSLPAPLWQVTIAVEGSNEPVLVLYDADQGKVRPIPGHHDFSYLTGDQLVIVKEAERTFAEHLAK